VATAMAIYTVIPKSAYDKTNSQAIIKYVKSIENTNKRTAHEYFDRLRSFEEFIKATYSFTIDELTIKKTFVTDVYDLLSSYVNYLVNRGNLSNISIKNRVVNIKNFLEFYDIDINPYKFKKRVKVPKARNQYKEALSKDDIIKMLENCKNFKLKTYLLCLATTGARASEAASIRYQDIDFKNSKLNIRAEYANASILKSGRVVFNICGNKYRLIVDLNYVRQWIFIRIIGTYSDYDKVGADKI
jgi:integrase